MKKTVIFRMIAAALAAILALAPSSALAGDSGAPAITGEISRQVSVLSDGIVRTHVTTAADSVYKTEDINVVSIDLSNRAIHFDVSYPDDNAAKLETTNAAVTRFAAEHGDLDPVIAFNADMWMVDYAQARVLGEGVTYMGYGDPVVKKKFPISRSFNIVEGEIYSTETIPQETPFSGVSMSFGITDDYVPILGNPSADLTLSGLDFSTHADGINRLPANNALIVYTDRVMGDVTDFALDDAYELVVDAGYDYTAAHGASITGTVTAAYGPDDADNPGPITDCQFVLTARGDRVADLEKFAVGDEITLDIAIVDLLGDDERWQRVENCVGGNFPLAVNGVPTTPLPLLDATYPATVIASDREGNLVFITMDGRQPGYSEGLHTYSSDQLMRDLDLYNALLLDGGGSTSIVVKDGEGGYTTVNRPSDGQDRAVNNSVIISLGSPRAAQGELELSTGSGIDADPVALAFDSRPTVAALVGSLNECSARYLGGDLKLTAGNLSVNDPFAYVDYSKIKTKINAEDYKYAALVYRLPETNSVSVATTEIFFNTNGAGARGGQSVTATVRATGRYETATFYAGSLTGWKGVVSSLRLDFFTSAAQGDTLLVHAIVFGRTQSEARFAAKAFTDVLNAPPVSTVTFVMNGHGGEIAPLSVPRGEAPERPADPAEDGWVFGGWYTSSTFATPYDFTKTLTGNVRVYAKWTQASDLPGDANGDGALNARDVRLIMRYIVGWRDDGVIEANLDYDGNGRVSARDVLGVMLAILSA